MSRLTDEEILMMNDAAKQTLIDLLMCNEKMREELDQFIDLFGYDEALNWLMKVLKTLNVRYSTNILLSDEGEIKLIDPDFYYRKERPMLKAILARVLTPIMFFFIQRFKERLANSMEDGEGIEVVSLMEFVGKELMGTIRKIANAGSDEKK